MFASILSYFSQAAALFAAVLVGLSLAGESLLSADSGAIEKKRVVFLAGAASHGYGAHEHRAGSILLAKSLQRAMPDFDVDVLDFNSQLDVEQLADADAIVMYTNGGEGHPVRHFLEEFDRLAQRGVGIICLHYAVEVPKGEMGDRFLDWIGGHFETHWSVNPFWTAEFESLPDHPVTRGVEPFSIHDEWYYHMRFREEMDGVTPILTAVPPASTLQRPDGPHSGNPHVRAMAGQPHHVAWAAEREDGGRGFGFTGGHYHWNWGDENFRRLVLNAIVWVAKAEVPEDGVRDQRVAMSDLEENQDYSPPDNFDRQQIRDRLGLPDNGR